MIEQQSGEQAVGAVAAPAAARAGDLATRALELPRTRTRQRLRSDELAFLWISRLIIICAIFVVLFPVVMVVTASLSAGSAFFSTALFPTQFTLDHYKHVLDPNINDFAIWFRNSAIVCLATAALNLAFVITTGYAFSRFRFIGKKYGLMSLLLIQMFPAQFTFIAFFYLLNRMNDVSHTQLFLNNLPGLVLVYLGGGIPFMAWLFKGYVDGLPRDLEESAYVDGATRWQAFYKIILPLTRPMMAVVFIFQIIGVYNDYILANFLISDSNKKTVAVGLQGFIANQFNQNWTDFAAGAVIAMLPILIVFMSAQRWLVSGLASGAVKG